MTTIRPSPFAQTQLPQSQVGTPRQDDAKAAAARAFFAQAMGQTQAAAAPAAPAAAPAAPVQRMAAVDPAEPPQKILRPGSLLDIRV